MCPSLLFFSSPYSSILNNVVFRSIILLLPPAFTQWLQTDGVILPSSVTLSSVGKAGLDAPDENDGDAAQVSE